MNTSGTSQGRLPPLLVVFVVALAVYLNTLPNGFVVDDNHQVVDNEWITSPRYLPEIFSSGVWDFEGRASSYYRPMMYVFYTATYMVFGLHPWGFHLVNILLHAGVAVVLLLLGQQLRSERPPAERWYLAPPFVAAVLFAVHPVHTEAVAWVAGLTDLSYTFFYLLSLVFYARSRTAWSLPYVFSLVGFLFALLCKEPAVTLPALLFAYEIVFHRGERSWRVMMLRLIPFCLVLTLYAGLRGWALGSLAPAVSSVTLPPSDYALNVLLLFSRYVKFLLFPVDLNFWHVFKPSLSFYTTDTMAALLALGGSVFVVFLVRSNRAGLFASVLTIVPMVPVFVFSRMSQGLENAFTERYLYLISAGFVLLLAEGSDWCRRRILGGTPIVGISLVVLVMAFSIGTVKRNIVWRDSYSLWSDAARKSPESPMARMNHGYALLSRQRVEEGRMEIREALRLKPSLLEEMNAKGVLYARKGLTKKAILEYHFILAARPDYAPAHYNLGVLYDGMGWIDRAIQEYEATVRILPDYADAHNNLGVALAKKGERERAIAHLETAVRIHPSDAGYATNLERARRLP